MEKDLPELIKKAVGDGNLRATTCAKEAVRDADLILICVGTPSNEDGSLDLSYSINVARQVGVGLKESPHWAVVVFRSTLLPGSVDSVLAPALEESSGQVWGKDFGICYNPEFLREGTAVTDFFEAPYAILGSRIAK